MLPPRPTWSWCPGQPNFIGLLLQRLSWAPSKLYAQRSSSETFSEPFSQSLPWLASVSWVSSTFSTSCNGSDSMVCNASWVRWQQNNGKVARLSGFHCSYSYSEWRCVTPCLLLFLPTQGLHLPFYVIIWPRTINVIHRDFIFVLICLLRGRH